MKFRTNFTQLKKGIAFLFLISFSFGSFGQNLGTKLSLNVGLGIPVTFFTVKSNLVGIYTGSARYSFNKTWSFEARLTSNVFYAKPNNPAKAVLDGTASDLVSYRTAMYGLHGMVYYNLHNIFGLNKRPESNWLPYLNAGFGYHIYKPSAKYVNGAEFKLTTFGRPCRDYQMGFGTRYFINSTMDLSAGVEYHFVESYYLDAVGTDKKLDNFVNIYAGVNIKIGAKPWNNLVDWSHKNMEDTKESVKNYSKWAADFTVGIPYMFTPVGYSFTGMFGIGIRHSFSKSMGLQLAYNHGNLSGGQTVTALAPGTGGNFTDAEKVKDFSTKINQYTVKAFFNLRNLASEPGARTNWNHYAILGGGYIYGNQNVTFADDTKVSDVKVYAKSGIQNIVVGYEARKYLSHSMDLIAGMDFSFNQSKYFDAAPNKASLNSHLYLHTGVTYKIGTSKDKEHIDWSYGTYNNYKDKSIQIEQVPVIEKPSAQDIPKIDTGMAVAPLVVEPTPAQQPIEPTPVTPVPPPVVTPEVIPATPTPTPPQVARPVKPAPRAVRPSQRPTSPAIDNTTPSTYQATKDVIPPPMRYNVVVACYSVNKLSVAEAYRVKLEKQGFSPSIYRSTTNSQMLRMSVISTDDRTEAINTLRRARKEVEPQSWIYLYNKQ
ncbi:MAG: hypothetical protein H7296_06600 [Bacteroidia bacterium]|nr:hypothetical protein [Bacteroidia bacterium]